MRTVCSAVRENPVVLSVEPLLVFFLHHLFLSLDRDCISTEQNIYFHLPCRRRRRRRRGRGRGRSRRATAAAAAVNVNPRGGATTTVGTERTKRRRNTRNINLINTAEWTHIYTTFTHTAVIRQTQKGKWLTTDAMTDFQAMYFKIKIISFSQHASYYKNIHLFKLRGSGS